MVKDLVFKDEKEVLRILNLLLREKNNLENLIEELKYGYENEPDKGEKALIKDLEYRLIKDEEIIKKINKCGVF